MAANQPGTRLRHQNRAARWWSNLGGKRPTRHLISGEQVSQSAASSGQHRFANVRPLRCSHPSLPSESASPIPVPDLVALPTASVKALPFPSPDRSA